MAVFIGTAIAVLLPGLLYPARTGGDPAVRDVLRIQYRRRRRSERRAVGARRAPANLQTLFDLFGHDGPSL